nr:MAG TPA: hypothetical protein [Caudoviricetes sp.]
MRITARMPASRMRIRITLPRIRMRTSAPGITDKPGRQATDQATI